MPRFRLLAACVLVLLVVLERGPGQAASDRITVNGTLLMRGGHEWIAKGVVITGLVAPSDALHGPYRAAHEHYGPAELDAAHRYGATLLRFQVSQPANDPGSPIYSAAYVDQLTRAIDLARARGFAVIVSMQSQKPSGLDEKGMPSDSTLRAWKVLAPHFANDPDVMLELFNEPAPFGPTPHDWQGWLRTTQPLVDEIRAMGGRNVLIADGLHWAQSVAGAPMLHDPLDQIVYGVHPYFAPDNRTRAEWERHFGRFAATHPVLATEWNATSKRRCFPDMPATAADLLEYLRTKKIGLVAWAFDLPGTLITNYNWTPTSFKGFHCGDDSAFGAGALVRRYFTGNAARN